MSIYSVINEVIGTTKTKEKIKILSENKDNESLKKILFHTYNNQFQYFIKKIPKVKETGTHTIDDSVDSIIDLLDRLNRRLITGNAAIELVTNFLGSFDMESQEIIIKVLKRDMRGGISAKTVNKVWEKLIPEFQVQLANTFDPKKPKEMQYFASPKLDGLRGVFILGEGLYTRNGKIVVGLEHIEHECKKFCEENNIGAMDGELFSDKIPFEKIQGFVTKDKNMKIEEKKQIHFNVFAVVKDFRKQIPIGSTKQMVDIISPLGISSTYQNITSVPQTLIPIKEIGALHDEFVNKGYEGIMLRHPTISYEFKRGHGILKYKYFKESDFTVVDVFEGDKKYKGMLGGFVIEGTVGTQTIKSKVGSGFSDEQRQNYWNEKEEFIGELAEIKYQGLTPDGSLRFPVYLKMKMDR